MKCEKYKFKYRIPSFSSVLHAVIRGKDYDMQLARISMEEIFSMLDKDIVPTGNPSCFAVNGRDFLIYPIPDKAYEVIIRYAPPVMEF